MVEDFDQVEKIESQEIPRSNVRLVAFEFALQTWGERRHPQKVGADAEDTLRVTGKQIQVGDPRQRISAWSRIHESEVEIWHTCGYRVASGRKTPSYPYNLRGRELFEAM